MSRYTVVWWPATLDELTQLWLESDDRAAVTADSREVDRRLAEQAIKKLVPMFGATQLVQ